MSRILGDATYVGDHTFLGDLSSPGSSVGSEKFGAGAAVSGADSSTFGYNSAAVANATANGAWARATANDSYAAGRDANVAGANSIGIGSGVRVRTGSGNSVVVGSNGDAAFNKPDCCGLGFGVNLDESGGVGLGYTAHVQIGHTNAVAIAKDSQTTAAQRTTIGRVGGTAAQLQELQVSAGFAAFGVTPPASRPSVTGSRGGNAALASLLTAIDATGLIIDGTSA